MIKEIIDAIGYNNIVETLKNKPLKGIYLKISKDRLLCEDDVLISQKEISVKDVEKESWFKDRDFYCDYISSNKAITKDKIILSNQDNCVKFKFSSIVKHANKNNKEVKDALKDIIIGYMDKLDSDNADYYLNNIDLIMDIILKNEKLDYVNIYLDCPIVDYINKYNKYIDEKAFNAYNNKTNIFVMINGKEMALGNPFINNSEKKIFVKSCNNSVEERINLMTAKDITRAVNLKEYIHLTKAKPIQTEFGIIKFAYDSSKKEIKSYCNTPYKEVDDMFTINNLIIHDYFSNRKSKIINSKFLFSKTMEDLDKGYKTTGKLSSFEQQYKKLYHNLESSEKGVFSNVIKRLISSLCMQYKYEGKKIMKNIEYNITDIINLDIALNDYFKGTNIREMCLSMKDKCINKILSMGDEYIIEDDKEFSFIAGTVASYHIDKSQSANKSILLCRYRNIKNVKSTINQIKSSVIKYGYNESVGSRSNKLYMAVLNYYSNNNSIHMNDTLFTIGLRSCNNIIYTK